MAAITLGSMGQVYEAQGNYEQALQLHREALRVKQAVLGNEHVSVGA